MALSPSSSVQRARQELAGRLRDIRLDAGLTARRLAAAAGWHESKTSRIENARQAVTDEDIRTWCRVSEADDQAGDLIAASRAADSMYVDWRRQNVTGLRRTQEARVPLFKRTVTQLIYCSTVVPGLFQTPEYATALLSAITTFRGTPEMMALPSVRFGIIPFAAERRPIWTLETFTCFDQEQVQVELLAAQVTVTVPREIRLYLDAFAELTSLAVAGDSARALIKGARDVL